MRCCSASRPPNTCSCLLPLLLVFLDHVLYVGVEPLHVVFTAARIEVHGETNFIGLIYNLGPQVDRFLIRKTNLKPYQFVLLHLPGSKHKTPRSAQAGDRSLLMEENAFPARRKIHFDARRGSSIFF